MTTKPPADMLRTEASRVPNSTVIGLFIRVGAIMLPCGQQKRS